MEDRPYLERWQTNGALVPACIAPRGDGLQREGHSVLGKVAYFATDNETPITEYTLPSLQWDMSVVRQAVACAQREPGVVVYAPVTMPGHHAGTSTFGGFCFLNNVAIAAKLWQEQRPTSRVAIVDVDYHAGNGTMQLVWNETATFFVSLHGDVHFAYPFNSGYADQKGAHDNVLNIPLRKGTTIESYASHLDGALDVVEKWKPDVLLISLGLDPLASDPVAFPLGTVALLPTDFATLGQKLLYDRFQHLPRIVFQEGGYLLSDVPDAVYHFLKGLRE